jgi:hypothetical protein
MTARIHLATIWMAMAGLTLALAFPPWKYYSTKGSSLQRSAGYSLIFYSPDVPVDGIDGIEQRYWSVEIDTTRYLLQVFALVAISTTGLFLLRHLRSERGAKISSS